jgi:hypothetical protein
MLVGTATRAYELLLVLGPSRVKVRSSYLASTVPNRGVNEVNIIEIESTGCDVPQATEGMDYRSVCALALATQLAIAETHRDPEQRAAFMKEHPCPSTDGRDSTGRMYEKFTQCHSRRYQ